MLEGRESGLAAPKWRNDARKVMQGIIVPTLSFSFDLDAVYVQGKDISIAAVAVNVEVAAQPKNNEFFERYLEDFKNLINSYEGTHE
mmetsp:Transcript_16476/g.21088  ORF Transcript_16476/g.21088 Transcript_16476/m.21088 type:complete len:87 (+) Transcript_16476:94-354(+)